MSYQTNSVDKNGLARTPDGKLYVTLGSGSTIDSPTFTGTITGAPQLLAASFSAVTAPADATEDTLATITIPANRLGANGLLRVQAFYSFTGSTNAKTLRARFSGGAGTILAAIAYNAVGNTAARIEFYLGNRNATNSQYAWSDASTNSGGQDLGGTTTTAVDTTAQTTFVITGQKATAGETLTLEGYVAEVLR